VTVLAGRPATRVEGADMAGKRAERFEAIAAESSLTFFAMSKTQSAYGKTTALSGFVEVAWDADGALAREPAPHMHVEFKVESLRTGNDLQDREMWKTIDSKRFPKVAGDLRNFELGAARGSYVATGQITLAGLERTYEGEFSIDRSGKRATLDGELKIDVRDFGLKPMKLLVLGVAPLVRVRLHLVAERTR
jgi:polyisoprenoid-binding protein YceI